MQRQRFFCFIDFVQNTEIHVAKHHDWPIIGSQLLEKWTTSYFLSYQDCHLFQQQFVFNKINRSVKLFQKKWDDYQIQLRLEVTSMHSGNRCWQILTSRPRETVNQHTKIFQTRCTRRIQRSQPFTVNLEDLECMCSHIPLKEWTQIRKVTLQKWRYKNGSTVFTLTSTSIERDLFHEQKILVTWKQ